MRKKAKTPSFQAPWRKAHLEVQGKGEEEWTDESATSGTDSDTAYTPTASPHRVQSHRVALMPKKTSRLGADGGGCAARGGQEGDSEEEDVWQDASFEKWKAALFRQYPKLSVAEFAEAMIVWERRAKPSPATGMKQKGQYGQTPVKQKGKHGKRARDSSDESEGGRDQLSKAEIRCVERRWEEVRAAPWLDGCLTVMDVCRPHKMRLVMEMGPNAVTKISGVGNCDQDHAFVREFKQVLEETFVLKNDRKPADGPERAKWVESMAPVS